MDLSVQQLRMLREVESQGTIAAAAIQLGYTSSAVSQQLAAIERITGVAVLEKVGRNVFLTDAGRELVAHATVILDQLEEAKAAVERVSSHPSGTLKVGMIESVANTILPPLLVRLAESHPEPVNSILLSPSTTQEHSRTEMIVSIGCSSATTGSR